MSDISEVKKLLMGELPINLTRIKDSANIKLWIKTGKPKKDKKQLLSLARYLTQKKAIKYNFYIIDLPGEIYDYSILEIVHDFTSDAEKTIIRWEEFKRMVS